MAKTAAPKEIIKALALLAHAAQQEQAMRLGHGAHPTRTAIDWTSLRSSRGYLCSHPQCARQVGSATRGAKDRIVDVLAFASDLGRCAIAGFKWRLPLFGPRIRQDLFVNK